MNVAIIRHSIRNRGGDKLILDYCGYLIAQGWKITYWTNEVKTKFTIPVGVQIRPIPFPGIAGTMFFALIRKFESPVVLVDLVIMASLISFRNQGRVVYLAQDYDVKYHRFPVLRWLEHASYRKVLRNPAVLTVAVSQGLTRQLDSYNPLNISTVPNGIDPEHFFPDLDEEFKKLKEGNLIVGLYARTDYRKGLDIAKEAVRILKSSQIRESWQLWTIGESPLKLPNIRTKHFGFIDSEDRLRHFLSAVDVFLVPSRHEGFGLLTVQAMACGCAIVSTEALLILTHQQDALLSPVGDAQSLAKNLEQVLRDQNLRKQLREGARNTVRQYSLKNSCENFEKILRELPTK